MTVMTATGNQKNRINLCLLLFFALLVSITVAPNQARAEQEDTQTERARKLKLIQDRIQQLQQALEKARAQQAQEKNRLRDIERAIASNNNSLRKLRRSIHKQKRELGRLSQKQAELSRELDMQRTILAGQIRASYMMGRKETLKIMLNQGQPDRIQRMLVYHEYLVRARSRQVHIIREHKHELEKLELVINGKQKELLASKQQQLTERASLQRARLQRKQLLASIDRDINSKGRRLESLRQAERELQKVLKVIQSALDDIPASGQLKKKFSTQKGSLLWPLQGRIARNYGTRRNIGNLRWKGVVIRAPRGREVRAISHGRIAFADWLRGYGMLIIIDHGDGYMSLYGQNDGLYREVGEWVSAGDLIATAGNSGGQKRTGVYFEIRFKGKPVNPRKWCWRLKGNRIAARQSFK